MTRGMTPANPSRRAAKRVTNPLPKPETCPYCESKVEWVNNKEVYNGTPYGKWPFVYKCTNCDAHVGMHPYTDIPLGTLANKQLRTARNEAKKVFQPLWSGHHNAPMTRSQAYEWLSNEMGISKAACHFGWFTLEQANKAKEICSTCCVEYQKLLPNSVVSLAQSNLKALERIC